jgi:hypothetical protein
MGHERTFCILLNLQRSGVFALFGPPVVTRPMTQVMNFRHRRVGRVNTVFRSSCLEPRAETRSTYTHVCFASGSTELFSSG